MKKGQKNPIITKLRKGKHFEDFVSKEKAKLWRKNIKKAQKKRNFHLTKKHKKIISDLMRGKKKSKIQRMKLRQKQFEYIINHKKEFLKRYVNRKFHTNLVKQIKKLYKDLGYRIINKIVIPDIVIEKNNKIYAVEIEKSWGNIYGKLKAYKELNLYKTIIFHDFKGNKIRRRL